MPRATIVDPDTGEILSATGRKFTHGRSGYMNYACRCEVCLEKGRAHNRDNAHRWNRPEVERTCTWCGEAFIGKRDALMCSSACRGTARALKGPELPPEWNNTRLSKLIERGEWPRIMARLLEDARPSRDCMEWMRQAKRGYPVVMVGGKLLFVHRLMLQAKHDGKPLGVLHGHHVCANSMCINPDHLQPATAAENVGEMLARQSFVARIEELETALRELAPGHEVLNRVPVDGA